MNPRTIVLSLGAHVVVIAVLVAIKAAPAARAPTMIQITEAKTATPKSQAPKSAAPQSAAPQSAAPPSAAPKPKVAKRKTNARPKATEAKPASRSPAAAPGTPPVFSGLVLGNADGPGMAVGVTEDVARGPALDGAGGGGSARLAAAIEPMQPAPPPKIKAATCARVERPRVLNRQQTIRYVKEARVAGAEGRMVLRLHVNAQGRVTRVEVVSPVHPALDREAIAAARTWRFAPEIRCGRAVASTFVIARRFVLTD